MYGSDAVVRGDWGGGGGVVNMPAKSESLYTHTHTHTHSFIGVDKIWLYVYEFYTMKTVLLTEYFCRINHML